ncbi:TPA: exodeoxyribonuclease V subunit beta [Klebsiella pneumoniae]|nr:exodeoxyribonuclease V subunit beta [Klebsiella pneumoniae]MDM7902782.1 exodeoxyribonuclease V subunit beta [Klebsiella pneumoniae]QCC79672.1 exodeoxyribonuclease V subunit beta [Klebsiella pneumoniae]HBR1544805.1 exodeoxyribonuclease V subunit beta [Klebsiella pneumoniae]HBZ4202815.1 exodeoxyribonuclease V subunit beta [Klebsiella pneumoniae]HCT6483444.1 exodeoxyribonuclease V subunit beta [Klebsiella pneumoniae]
MTDTAESLDPLRLPLIGERLIEASAGTGKTFTIAALYLRLLLGLGGEAAYPRAISVEELLVVTFTEAATEELRGRIRSNIHELRIACLRGESDNPLYSALLAEIADKDDAAKTLLLAERQMDEAAVFTIHSFCQRMLSLNAFESGMLFEQQLIEDESRLRYQACADFWRRHCYPLTRDIAAVIHDVWKGPRDLLKSLDRWLQGEAPQLKSPPAPNETLAERHQQIIARIDSLKQQWREQVGEIEGVLENSGLDRRKFNRGNQGKWMEKVNAWAQEETLSYQLPDALEKFAQSFLLERTKAGGEPPVHPLFSAVESLLASSLTLTDLVLARAMVEIRDAVAREKRRRGELGFDDMLSRLDEALRGDSGDSGETLASAIRQRFPVAMIDEFQDTDPQQYRIFRRIWRRQPETALLLIGDPKQAIYAFRGADIFTYMKARGDVAAHYTLDTNWRSSPGMVGSVNRLFSLSDNPFMFHEIPFLPVKAAAKNKGLRFTVDAADVPAMNVWLMPGDTVGSGDYQTFMAQLCATQIRDWLSAGQQGRALLWRGETSRPVQASDITVLVRNRLEAAQVREALQTLGIPSVYLSNRDSVFETLEAQELLWLLQAVLAPERENTLRSALATSMFGLTALDIENLNQDEQAWDALVEEFSEYRQIWRQRGVMPMLRALMTARHIAENLLATRGGERRLTDILHISELLQEAASQLESEHALVRWLAQHIAEPDSNAASQQMRLESDKHLVQIVTIHKSKGLEYPLVWLPFIARFRKQDQAFYHDRETFAAVLDLGQDEASLELAEAERLAEDLRLLYVALTRAVWHCSLGVAPLSSRKSGNSDFHLSALGRLLQAGEAMDAAGLAARLADFCHGDIALQIPGELDLTPWQAPAATIPRLSARELQRRIADDWRVTSYSGLQQHGFSGGQDLLPRLDVDAAGVGEVVEEPQLTPHQFPRGAAPGTFLHSLFEELDFTQPVPEGWMAEKLQLSGFDAQWAPVLTDWLGGVLKTRLPGPDIALNQLAARDKQVEMAFYLPIAQLLTAERLDALIRQYDPLSADTPPLDFRQVRGMLKGFIDLVFRHEGRYYLLDYKSNWLGEDREAYTRPAMEQAMRAHRYDLQYQLYSLALHRYLRHRLADYDYDRHFGGVIYLFLRGMDGQEGGQGIFTTRPVRPLIDGLDQLFAGETQEEAS